MVKNTLIYQYLNGWHSCIKRFIKLIKKNYHSNRTIFAHNCNHCPCHYLDIQQWIEQENSPPTLVPSFSLNLFWIFWSTQFHSHHHSHPAKFLFHFQSHCNLFLPFYLQLGTAVLNMNCSFHCSEAQVITGKGGWQLKYNSMPCCLLHNMTLVAGNGCHILYLYHSFTGIRKVKYTNFIQQNIIYVSFTTSTILKTHILSISLSQN